MGSSKYAGIVPCPQESKENRDNCPSHEQEPAPKCEDENRENGEAQNHAPWIGVAQPGCIVHPEQLPNVLSKVIGFIVRLWYYYHKNGGHNSSGMTTLNRYGAAHVFYYFWGDLLLHTRGITQ
jgi:hypothetical protein